MVSNSYIAKRREYYEWCGQKLPVNADGDYRCIPMLLDKLAEQMTAAIELHSKVLFVRVDLTSINPDSGNEPMECLLRWLKQWLRRYYKMQNIGHFWVIEQSRKKGTHWHLILLLDGNRAQNSGLVIDRIKYRWEVLTDSGLVSIPKNCFYQIRRGDDEAFAEAFYRGSYLAKERSKQSIKNGCTYGASKLKTRAHLND
tara:strand:- start:3745 stop:4341 length:597 start_codon:yes stop_codon:yes gene_type:complete